MIWAPCSLSTLCRSLGSKVSSVPGLASTISSPAPMRASPYDRQPGTFADLVVTQLLTWCEPDHDRPRSVDRLEDCWRTRPFGSRDLRQVPRLHCSILGR